MMHWEADDLVGDFVCDGEVCLLCTREILVGIEVRNQGIEVPATEDALFLHEEVQFVTSFTVFLGIYHNREVGEVPDEGFLIFD